MTASDPITRLIVTGMLALAVGFGWSLAAEGQKGAELRPPRTIAVVRGAAQVMSLRALGAIGNGKTDDSAALRKAFAQNGGQCLDGEGRRYATRGTVRVANDLCLNNAVLIQMEPSVASRPYVSASCPLVTDPSVSIDCGDPTMATSAARPFLDSLSTRTLFIRPDEGRPRLKVRLTNVTVDRGSNATAGSRTDAAGIWIAGADEISMDAVEITGMGRGFGLLIADSQNVRIRNLNVHDLTWAPYPADLPAMNLARLKDGGWNNATIREFRESRAKGRGPGFLGMRVQEQLSCVFLTRVRNIQIDDLTIKRCMARLGDKLAPWQADGLGIGPGVKGISINRGAIDTTWEAIDLGTGDGGSGFIIRDLRISNAFGYGIKVGFRLSDLLISDVKISNAGLGGIDLRGDVERVTIERTTISETGVVIDGTVASRPWPAGSRAGIRLQRGIDGSHPRHVIMRGVRVRNPTSPRAYAIGIRSEGEAGQFQLFDVDVQDFSASKIHNDP